MSIQIVLFLDVEEGPKQVFALALAAMERLGDELGSPVLQGECQAYNQALYLTVGAHQHRARILRSERKLRLTVFFDFTDPSRHPEAWLGMMDICMHLLSKLAGDALLLYQWEVILARLDGVLYLNTDPELGFWADPERQPRVTLPFQLKRLSVEPVLDRPDPPSPKAKGRRRKG